MLRTDVILDHLRTLIAADTSDPPAMITPEHEAVAHCVRVLEGAGCTVVVKDLGHGCVNVLAVRGTPSRLFNCHLDTVKPNPAWTRNPFELTVEHAHAYGLGACDIKGAAACLLAVAQAIDDPFAVLFTTDEEGGKGVCIDKFLKALGQAGDRSSPWESVIVAEPTGAEIVRRHRGFASFEVRFTGVAGHTSGEHAAERSALHRAVRWASGALDLAAPEGVLDGARFNIGIMQGGTASNVVAAETTVRFGFRPEPERDAEGRTAARIAALKEGLPDGAEWVDRFVAPPLNGDPSLDGVVGGWGVGQGRDVDFWTEAALFEAGGIPAVVLGPGDIAQAHTADEFVEIAQLEACAAAYASIVRSGGDPAVAGGVAE